MIVLVPTAIWHNTKKNIIEELRPKTGIFKKKKKYVSNPFATCITDACISKIAQIPESS